MNATELAHYIASREESKLALFEGDVPSAMDRMRWKGKELAEQAHIEAKIKLGERRHIIFRRVYAERLQNVFGLTINKEEKCYIFGGYKFYPQTNEIWIDGFRIERGFVFIDKLLRNLNA